MPLWSRHPRIAGYCAKTVGRYGYSGKNKDVLKADILELLERLEVDDRGLRRRIEDKLAIPREFAGSSEQKILRMAIDSVVGDGRIRRGRDRTEPLENAASVSAGDDDDPALIADRKERKEILAADLKGAIEGLPMPEQEILAKVFWEDRTQSDVARSQNRSRQRVHDDLNKAIELVAEKIAHLRDHYVPDK